MNGWIVHTVLYANKYIVLYIKCGGGDDGEKMLLFFFFFNVQLWKRVRAFFLYTKTIMVFLINN